MVSIDHRGYFPFTIENIERYVPARPGVFVLAVQLPNAVHQTFFTSQAENLNDQLTNILTSDGRSVPEVVLRYMREHRCCFTFYLIPHAAYRREIVKMLASTADPVTRLMIAEAQ